MLPALTCAGRDHYTRGRIHHEYLRPLPLMPIAVAISASPMPMLHTEDVPSMRWRAVNYCIGLALGAYCAVCADRRAMAIAAVTFRARVVGGGTATGVTG